MHASAVQRQESRAAWQLSKRTFMDLMPSRSSPHSKISGAREVMSRCSRTCRCCTPGEFKAANSASGVLTTTILGRELVGVREAAEHGFAAALAAVGATAGLAERDRRAACRVRADVAPSALGCRALCPQWKSHGTGASCMHEQAHVLVG